MQRKMPAQTSSVLGERRRKRSKIKPWSSPRKMDTGLRVVRVVRPLEFLRRQEPQGGVSADAVVKRLHVLEDACPCLLSGRVRLVVDQLPLQRGEEALHRRVVPA